MFQHICAKIICDNNSQKMTKFASLAGRAFGVKNEGVMGMGVPLVRTGWRPPGLSLPLRPLSSPAPQNPELILLGITPWAPPHAYVNGHNKENAMHTDI